MASTSGDCLGCGAKYMKVQTELHWLCKSCEQDKKQLVTHHYTPRTYLYPALGGILLINILWAIVVILGLT